MIIDFRKISREGKTEKDFSFEYLPEYKEVGLPDTEIVPPIYVNGKVYLTGRHSAFIDAEIKFTLKGECTRCLAETERTFTAELKEEVDETDPDSYKVVNDTVNLSKMVDDKILMTVPVSFLCKEDCKGICAGCGVNLNDGECKCEK